MQCKNIDELLENSSHRCLLYFRSYYVKNESLARICVKHDLQHHLLYLAPKLQASIERYLSIFQDGLDNDEELYTEDDDTILTVSSIFPSFTYVRCKMECYLVH